MLEIKGIFLTGKVKKIRDSEVLTIINREKDNMTGEYNKAYYQMWLNDKVKELLGYSILNKINDDNSFALLEIEGYLKVVNNNNYTNLTIIPISINEKR